MVLFIALLSWFQDTPFNCLTGGRGREVGDAKGNAATYVASGQPLPAVWQEANASLTFGNIFVAGR